ncbi:hypothetical protein EMPS_05181 [Entomortierella parvispora]|uniref:Uncharacterized protein n=1 Tax=Entomortierella parvispora TaxID=205924 RepID=A0A9P3HAC4_9FUNG|nr:hypothetical protein EMPS_05181 [Entomortierella parvispora]
MSAYKQRTSYHHHRQRDDHSSDLRDEDFTQEHHASVAHASATTQPPATVAISTSATTIAMASSSISPSSATPRDIHPSFATSSTTATFPHHLHHLHASTASSGLFQSLSHVGSSYHTAAEDEQEIVIVIENNPADLEWTPVRNSVSVARAKQRQQQYRERQQERTREWQSLLNQHYRPTTPTTATATNSQQQQPSQGSYSSSSSSWVAAGSPRQGLVGVGNSHRIVSYDGSNTQYSGISGKSEHEELLLPPGDTHHEIIPGSGPRAPLALRLHPGSSGARAVPTMVMVPTTPSAATEEQLSSGFSDLMTSDGLESLGGGSEDLGGWSQAEDEADELDEDEGEVLSFTLSTASPMLQRHRLSFPNAASPSVLPSAPSTAAGSADFSTQRPPVSARSRSSSSATSLSQLPRPSFAAVPSTSNSRTYPLRPQDTHSRTPSSLSDGLQNQMPLHDGSGNFVDLMEGHPPPLEHRSSSQTIDLLSDLDDSSLDLDLDWESSSSHESSLLRTYQQPLNASFTLRRRISSSEFKTVIQNIADLQHQSAMLPHQNLNPSGSHNNLSSSSHSQGILSSPLSLSRLQWRPTQNVGLPGSLQDSSRPRFTYLYSGSRRPIFNIYEDEMENMADMMYEMPARLGWVEAFQTALMALEPCESSPYSLEGDKWHPVKVLTALSADADRSESDGVPKEQPQPAASQGQGTSHHMDKDDGNKEALRQIRENMNATTMEAMQKLQQNGRRRTAGRPIASQGHPYRHHYRGPSFDPMQVDFSPTVRTQEQDSGLDREGDGGLISQSTGTSTSHRMLDSNLWAVVLSTLRRFRDHVQSNFLFDTYEYEDEDLGVQRSTSSTSRARLTRENLAQFRSGPTTRSTSSSVSSYSNRGSGVRRVNSDCGMESLRDHLYSHSTYPHRQLEPRLVE